MWAYYYLLINAQIFREYLIYFFYPYIFQSATVSTCAVLTGALALSLTGALISICTHVG